jgi:putative addiction module component (TIGR02574 family)
MSVKQLESAIAALPPNERREFIHWLDDHRHELVDEADDFALTAEQKAELLRRRKAFLADPSIAGPWEGTPEKIHQHLHARRAQKTSGSRS